MDDDDPLEEKSARNRAQYQFSDLAYSRLARKTVGEPLANQSVGDHCRSLFSITISLSTIFTLLLS